MCGPACGTCHWTDCSLDFFLTNMLPAMLKRIRRPFRIQLRNLSTPSNPYNNYTKIRGQNLSFSIGYLYIQLKIS